MADILVTSPFQPFTLPTQFKAVFNGYIYCGTVDAVDPSVSQVQVYLVNEAGDKVPVAQPLRTNAGGFLVYNGQPAKFVTDSNHSLLVQDSFQAQVWYAPNMATIDPETALEIIGSEAREALRRTYLNAGLVLVAGSFEMGGSVSTLTDVLLFEAEMKAYSWGGAFPKTVPAGSTPSNSGGISPTAWIDRSQSEASFIQFGPSAVMRTMQGKVREAVSTSDFAKTIPTMAQISGVIGDNEFSRLTLSGFHVSNDKGGGVFYWDPAKPKTAHNGGTVIDPNIVFPADWNNAPQVTAWYTAAVSGTGCWVRQQELGYLMAEWFGARPWVIGGTQDSTKPFQQCANVAGHGGSWRWAGRHRITSFVEIPPKQTFGSFGQMTSVNVEIFDPANFQGVHTSPFPTVADKIDSACFYDATTGEAFRCHEGAEPVDFLLYGHGYNTTGMPLTPNLPPASSYYDTSGIRHGKYIKPRNVTIILFKHPFDSFPWSTGGSFVGDYYSTHTDCEVMWCYDILRVATSASYNTKFVNLRALVNRIGDFGVEARNLQFVGGAIEGFNAASDIRLRSSTSFVGTYFETTATNFNGVVFNLVGFTTLTFRDCLVFLNGVNIFVSSGGSGQSTGVNYLTLNSSGNTWRRTDALAGTVFSVAAVPNKTVGIFGDVIDLSNVGSALTYYTGPAPTGIYSAPITVVP